MPKIETIRVMLVDDHAMVRSGLAAFLFAQNDLELVAEASSGEQAVAICRDKQPDVVLMDLVMPEMSGAEATQLILDQFPGTCVNRLLRSR